MVFGLLQKFPASHFISNFDPFGQYEPLKQGVLTVEFTHTNPSSQGSIFVVPSGHSNPGSQVIDIDGFGQKVPAGHGFCKVEFVGQYFDSSHSNISDVVGQ